MFQKAHTACNPAIGCLLFVASLLPSVQCQAQYDGGVGDGTSHFIAIGRNPFSPIYEGAGADGFANASASATNPLLAIYSGGTSDGFSQIAGLQLNPMSSIYMGGQGDGFMQLQASGQNPFAGIYSGGSNDGSNSLAANGLNALFPIYSGGSADGFQFLNATGSNPLSSIYSGGVGDGFTISFAYGLHPPGALPVMIQFDARWFYEDAVLSWTTTAEHGLNHFIVQRSDNGGKNFMDLHRIEPAGNPGPNDYRYEDALAARIPVDYLLYRLKSVEDGGNAIFSAIIRLGKEKTSRVIAAYPNPTSGHFMLAIMNEKNFSSYSYMLIGMNGQLIKKGPIQASVTEFDMREQAAGIYQLILLQDNTAFQTLKVVFTR